jgi:hypothetical protein
VAQLEGLDDAGRAKLTEAGRILSATAEEMLTTGDRIRVKRTTLRLAS